MPDDASVSIWLRPARGRRGPVPALDRERIASAGMQLADRRGLAAATMRTLAEEIGTKPASLYRYVRTRDELVELMVDRAVAEIALERPHRSGLDNLRALAHRCRECYLRHPWMLEALATPLPLGPHTAAYLDHALSIIDRLAVPARRKLEAIAIMNSVTAALVRTELDQGAAGVSPVAQRSDPTGYLGRCLDDHSALAAVLGEIDDEVDPAVDVFDRIIGDLLTGVLRRRPQLKA